MDAPPPTRVTLLVRLRDLGDQEAWSQFVDLYAPLIYRFARKHSLQDADAADLTQDVLRAVARSMPSFHYDPDRGTFRSWLLTIARHEIQDFHAGRRRRCNGSGDTSVQEQLSQQPEPPSDELWDREYQQRLFEWAVEQVRPHVQEATWNAFWRTAVDGDSPQAVAAELGLSVGAVYIARSRVLARLRSEIERIEREMA